MPGSSESGAVPNTWVIVPPDFPLVVVDVFDVVVELLPHAASALAAPSAATAIKTERNFVLMILLLREVSVPARKKYSTGRTPRDDLIYFQHARGACSSA
jgi:hypothetical protein